MGWWGWGWSEVGEVERSGVVGWGWSEVGEVGRSGVVGVEVE